MCTSGLYRHELSVCTKSILGQTDVEVIAIWGLTNLEVRLIVNQTDVGLIEVFLIKGIIQNPNYLSQLSQERYSAYLRSLIFVTKP